MADHEVTRRKRPLLAFIIAIALTACSEAPRDVSVHEELVSINGTELFVKRMGQGEPIVIVHGGPVLEHGYLLPHLEPLAESYELVFFDQRLSGRSAGEVDSSSVRVDTLVNDIEALRQSLGLGPIHLLGHSWGGLLAMRYAVGYPDHLTSMILVSSMSASSELWQQEEAQLAERRTEEDLAEFEAIRATEAFNNGEPNAIASILRASFKLQFSDRSKIGELELYVPEDYTERSRQFGYMMGDLTNFDFHEELAVVPARTLIIYGSAEPALELGGAALHEHFPNSELVVVEGAGHFPFIEQPADFFQTIRVFLNQGPEEPR